MSDIMELVDRLKPSYLVDAAMSDAVFALRIAKKADAADALNSFIIANNALKSEAKATIERLVAERDEARRHLYLVRNDRDNLSDHVHLAESRCERLVEALKPFAVRRRLSEPELDAAMRGAREALTETKPTVENKEPAA